jgi:AbrB family looped-hinge helix DNA binding protein
MIYGKLHWEAPIMSAATITSKGQITIPKDIRELFDLNTGDKINFIVEDSGEVRIVPVIKDVRGLKGIVAHSGKPVTIDEMNATVKRRGSRN